MRMDTIRNYIEQIFGSLPVTEELMQLKQEILENMEDKYNELKESGKNENEAVGTVISEFGNIDELLEELNLQGAGKFYEKEGGTDGTHMKNRRLTDDEVYDYLFISKVTRRMIAIGIFLCISGASLLILLGGYFAERNNKGYPVSLAGFKFGEGASDIFGVVLLLIFVSVGITLFILAGAKNERYAFLEKEPIALSELLKAEIGNIFDGRKGSIAVKNCIGVVLCIGAVIQFLISSVLLRGNELSVIISLSVMLLIIALAVYFFIIVNSEKGAYQRILQEGDFDLKKKSDYVDTISSIYWCTVTAVYLGWSFTTGKWGSSWLIWPVTGVIWAALEGVLRLVRGNKEAR